MLRIIQNMAALKYVKYKGRTVKVLPRIQFRTNGELNGSPFAGAAGTEREVEIDIHEDSTIEDWVHDQIGAFDVKVEDQFRRYWTGNNSFVRADDWSIWPGNGIYKTPHISRHLRDVAFRKEVKSVENERFVAARDTRLRVTMRKRFGITQEVNFGAMVTAPWSSRDTDFPDELQMPEWWDSFHVLARPWVRRIRTTGLDGVSLTDSIATETLGDTMLAGINYSGGANIRMNLRSSDQSMAGQSLCSEAMRIDMLAAITVAGATGINDRSWQWPGAYYIRQGNDIVIDMESLAGVGVPVNEEITLWGYFWNYGDENT